MAAQPDIFSQKQQWNKKWRTLWLLSLAELLGMAVWFSASRDEFTPPDRPPARLR